MMYSGNSVGGMSGGMGSRRAEGRGTPMKKVLFVQGSLRTQSFNRQLQKEIVAALGDAVVVDELAYSDVAPINQDDEWPTPAPVARVRAEVQAADAIWVVSPQYNGSFPGHVKNLFDWLSRPLEQGKPATAAKGKKITVSGIGGRTQTAEMRAALSTFLRFIGMDTMDEEGSGYAVNASAWVSNVVEFSDEQQASIKRQVKEFLAFIEA